jgi:acetyltransferase/esterase
MKRSPWLHGKLLALAVAVGVTLSAVPGTVAATVAAPSIGYLPVPGARLYYEVQGSGPTILMIHAGTGEADDWHRLRAELTSHYRVVTYDRRGSSRSELTRPAGWITVRRQADDAAALLEHVGGGPAHVLGSSGGGTVALDLVARYPRLVRTVVPHEAAVCEMGGATVCGKVRRLGDLATEVYHASGNSQLGMLVFVMGVNDEDEPEPGAPPPPELTPEQAERHLKNDGFFLAHEIREFLAYDVPVARLRAVQDKIIPAYGRYAAKGMKQEIIRLAKDVGTRPPVVFPGGHTGYVIHPTEFAAELRRILA